MSTFYSRHTFYLLPVTLLIRLSLVWLRVICGGVNLTILAKSHGPIGLLS